jgi:hypothetical protein
LFLLILSIIENMIFFQIPTKQRQIAMLIGGITVFIVASIISIFLIPFGHQYITFGTKDTIIIVSTMIGLTATFGFILLTLDNRKLYFSRLK